tara:strand:+ start:373 stop:993 length:621 start_codon:yes stop_codon:yes gene_type:complete
MKHLLIILSILLLSSPVIGQKSSLEVKEMTSLEGVLYRSPKGGWTFKEKENSDRKYLGEIKNGLPSGLGILKYDLGWGWKKYDGEFKDGKEHGLGYLIYPYGSRYLGSWKNGKMNGRGTFTYPNGEKYVGEWKDGKEHGQGTTTFPNGDRYVGEYKDGDSHGQGTFTSKDGGKFIGEWKDDKEWNGNNYNKDGNVISKYVNGVKHK